MQFHDKKAVISWGLYDWANSAYATTVMAGFFPIFFKQFWSAGVDPTTSTARLGVANSLSGILMACLAPMLGAIADKGTAKKKFLMFFAYMGVVMTSALYLVSMGNWLLAIMLYVFSSLGFTGANIFYDALLPGVAAEENLDIVSALGYSLGYLGGGLLFALNVWMTLQPAKFGFANAENAVNFAFLTVGLWWAVFSIPVFLFVKEPPGAKKKPGINLIKAGFVQLGVTFQEFRHLKSAFLFLAAYWLYIDGVDTIVRMAVDYGMSIGFDTNDLIKALLITQFVGFPAAIAFGFLGNKIGARRGIFFAIAVYFSISIWASFMQDKREFYLLAIMIGLVQGGVQALSRSFYARIIPADKSAEFFGFYNMMGKFATFFGPLLMAGTGVLIRSLGYSSDFASRLSITSIALLFLTGGILFYFVDEDKAKQEARYLTDMAKRDKHSS